MASKPARWPIPDSEVVAGVLEEMDYRTGKNQFGRETSVSIPAQLRFTEPVDQDTERFHDALEQAGFSPLDSEPDRSGTNPDRRGGEATPFYEGEVCSTDHYNRLKVLVFRGNVVRLFSRDGHVPPSTELKALLESIETCNVLYH